MFATFRAPWYVCTGLSLPLGSGVRYMVHLDDDDDDEQKAIGCL